MTLRQSPRRSLIGKKREAQERKNVFFVGVVVVGGVDNVENSEYPLFFKGFEAVFIHK